MIQVEYTGYIDGDDVYLAIILDGSISFTRGGDPISDVDTFFDRLEGRAETTARSYLGMGDPADGPKIPESAEQMVSGTTEVEDPYEGN